MNHNVSDDQYGIAYSWHLAPHGLSDFDLILVSASCNAEGKEQIVNTVFLKIKEKGIKAGVQDISGILGLLWGGTDEEGKEKADIFERTVADVILWHIEKMPNISEGKKRVVLIQGPMLPKLRGRLQYRLPHKERILICTVTYQREWLRRLEMSTLDRHKLESTEGYKGSITLGELFPPSGIDSGSRTWFGKKEAQPYQIEAITCTQPIPQSKWIESTEEIIYHLFDDMKSVKVNEDELELPKCLSHATSISLKRMVKERMWLKIHAKLEAHDLYGKSLEGLPENMKQLSDFLERRPELPQDEQKSDFLPGTGFEKRKAAADSINVPIISELRCLLLENEDILKTISKSCK